jgi:hypothetical protein
VLSNFNSHFLAIFVSFLCHDHDKQNQIEIQLTALQYLASKSPHNVHKGKVPRSRENSMCSPVRDFFTASNAREKEDREAKAGPYPTYSWLVIMISRLNLQDINSSNIIKLSLTGCEMPATNGTVSASISFEEVSQNARPSTAESSPA